MLQKQLYSEHNMMIMIFYSGILYFNTTLNGLIS